MKIFQFLFLSRNWNKDQRTMRATLDSILETGPEKLALLLYPEGTNMSRNQHPKSLKFAERIGRRGLKNVLLPHSTGLYFCIKSLQSRLDHVYLLVRLTELIAGFYHCL